MFELYKRGEMSHYHSYDKRKSQVTQKCIKFMKKEKKSKNKRTGKTTIYITPSNIKDNESESLITRKNVNKSYLNIIKIETYKSEKRKERLQ